MTSETKPGRGGKRLGAGRPRKPAGDKKVLARFSVDMEPVDLEAVDVRAREDGVSRSTWVRNAIFAALNAK